MKLNFAHLHNVIHYSFHQHRRHRQYCRYRHHRYFHDLFIKQFAFLYHSYKERAFR